MSLSVLVTNLSVTGSTLIYNANLTGIGSVQVYRSGDYIYFSGAAGTGGGGSVTGGITQGQLDALSGFVTGVSGSLHDQIATSAAGVTSINGESGALTIVGAGGVSVSTNGQTITVSGSASTGSMMSDLYAFLSPIPTGVDNYFVSFQGNVFSIPPIVTTTLETALTTAGYFSAISGRSTTGFYALFSDIVLEQGLYLDVLAQGNMASATVLAFLTGIPTGSDTYLINFPGFTFGTPPYVVVTTELNGSSNYYGVVISGRSTTGFYALFSDIVTDSGVYLDVIASD